MRKILSILLAGTVSWAAADVAEACGVKLTVRAPKIRAAKRSSNPSLILLVGKDNTKRLASELKKAGHKVEVVSSPADAKRKRYGLVMADSSMLAQSKDTFASSNVVAKKGSSRIAAKNAEKVLARAKVNSGSRTLVASGGNSRQAVDSGSTAPKAKTPTRVRASSGTLDTPTKAKVAAMTPPTVKRPAVSKPAPVKAVKPKAQIDTAKATTKISKPEKVAINVKKPKPERTFEEETRRPIQKAAVASWNEEFHFGSGSNRINGKASRLLRANVQWLIENPSVTITIHGHTDAVGDDEGNMRLGQRRADAAKAYMVRKGIDASRIEAVSQGENETKYESNWKNRRIEFVKN